MFPFENVNQRFQLRATIKGKDTSHGAVTAARIYYDREGGWDLCACITLYPAGHKNADGTVFEKRRCHIYPIHRVDSYSLKSFKSGEMSVDKHCLVLSQTPAKKGSPEGEAADALFWHISFNFWKNGTDPVHRPDLPIPIGRSEFVASKSILNLSLVA
jgi:hypothetical protein